MNTEGLREVKKSRDLSVKELFEVLQLEYIVCEIRYKIYPIQSHKDYWKVLMENKKEKILDISKRKKLVSIFDYEGVKKNVESQIIPEIGFPNFIYKNDYQKLMQEKWDIHNYYLKGAKVKVYSDSKYIIGEIEKVDFKEKLAIVNIDNDMPQTFELDLITRIL